jgi:hypothetical protein
MDLAADLRSYVTKQEQASLRRIRALPQSQRLEVLAPLLDFKGWVAPVGELYRTSGTRYMYQSPAPGREWATEPTL